jgi:hypothetical protein
MLRQKVRGESAYLLETGAAESNRAVEEFAADAVIGTHGLGDFVHVGARGFAHRRDRVDARNALRQERIRNELREFRRPHVGRDNAFYTHHKQEHTKNVQYMAHALMIN